MKIVGMVSSAAWTQRASRSRAMSVDVKEGGNGCIVSLRSNQSRSLLLVRQSLRGNKSLVSGPGTRQKEVWAQRDSLQPLSFF